VTLNAGADIQAITKLVYSYAELFDIGDFDSAVALFENATISVGGADFEVSGTGVRSLLTDLVQLHDGIPATKHIVANLMIDIEPDEVTASARSYYVALQARPDFPLQPILAGRWHDKFEKFDGEWRFVNRVIYSDLMGDITHHIIGSQ
jgi:3-phenylpropionate/cinnamic acid dioxygenase small subunit